MPSEGYDVSALTLPVDRRPSVERRSSSPLYTRPSTFRRSTTSRSSPSSQSQFGTWWKRTRRDAHKYFRRTWKIYSALTPLQKIGVIIFVALTVVLAVAVLVYNGSIFASLAGFAQKWRDMHFGWLILWSLTCIVAFPPLIGYSTLLSLAGFVYGFPMGWPIVATASVVGSTISFVCCRYLFRDYVNRLVARDTRFAALALTVKHDGLKLLVLIRLCPLPYSLSNGAVSTIPTVNVAQFALATTAVTPKLLVHVFIGARLADLAEHGGDMDAKTKAISYASIALGSAAGIATGWFIYRQTKRRAWELEAQQRDHVRRASAEGNLVAEYADDPAALEAAVAVREDEDDISLRDGDDWLEDESLVGDEDADADAFAYRDLGPSTPRGLDEEDMEAIYAKA